jgi:hypothetical protein
MRVVLLPRGAEQGFSRINHKGGLNLTRGSSEESRLRARIGNGMPGRPGTVAGTNAMPDVSNPDSSLLFYLSKL